MCLVFASFACSLLTVQSLDQQSQDDDTLKKLASAGKGMVQCRLCKGDHWTTHCPYKESLDPGPASEGATGQCTWEEERWRQWVGVLHVCACVCACCMCSFHA